MPFVFPGVVVVFVLLIIVNSVRVLREYERGVIFRLGRYVGTRGPGLIILVPFIERMEKVSLRTVTMDSVTSSTRGCSRSSMRPPISGASRS